MLLACCRAAVGGAVYIAGLGTDTVSQTNFTDNTFLSNAANLTSSGVVSGGGGLCTLMGAYPCSMAVRSSRTVPAHMVEPLYTYMNVFQVQQHKHLIQCLMHETLLEFTRFGSCDIIGHAVCACCCGTAIH